MNATQQFWQMLRGRVSSDVRVTVSDGGEILNSSRETMAKFTSAQSAKETLIASGWSPEGDENTFKP